MTESTRPTSGDDRDGFAVVDEGAEPAGTTAPVIGAPSDNTTLTGVLRAFEDDGFTDQLIAEPAGRVRCVACGETVEAADLDVRASRRLEGASDPDDMMTVIAARCPSCGSAGTLVLGYGPNASEDDVAIHQALRAERPPTADDPTVRGPSGQPAVDPDAPGASLFLEGDDVEPNEPA
jgi:hypothetical protein